MSEPHRLPVMTRSISSRKGSSEDVLEAPSPPHEWQHPPSFLCPISRQCMHDPVVLSDGHAYERQHIERWLSHSTTSPVTGLELSQTDTYPNHALRNAIDEYFNEVFCVHRQAIRKTIRSRRGSRDLTADSPLARTLGALMQSALLANADHSVEYILRQIMGEAKKLVGAEVASVFLVDTARQELYSTVNSTNAELRIPITAGIAGHVATTGETLIINDAYADARFNKAVDRKTGLRTRNVLCAPLKVRKGDVVGVVQLINKTGGGVMALDGPLGALPEAACDDAAGRPFTADDSHFLQVFASQAATAVANDISQELGQARQPATRPEVAPTPKPKPEAAPRALLLEPAPAKAPPPPRKQPSEAWGMPREATALLEQSLDGWDLDVVRLTALTDNRPLSSLGCFLLERLGLVARLGLDREKLRAFFLELERGYDDAVQYHNRLHAASVLHLTHAALRSGALPQKAAAKLCEGGGEADGALETLACLLAAAAHDFGHAGRTNGFLVKTGHDRAVCYNDRHVNENYHAARSFALLQRPGLDFLAALPREDFRRLRGLFVELVLATDMASNKSLLESFGAALDGSAAAPGETSSGSLGSRVDPEDGGFQPGSAAEAVLLLQVALVCADLGHLTLSRALHLYFVRGLEAEFFAQGDQERALGLEVSFLMDREKLGVASSQVGFFELVALPMFRCLARACRALQPMLRGAEDNYIYWKGLQGQGGERTSPVSEAPAARSEDGPSDSEAASDDDAGGGGRRRSGRARQRKAKWLAAVRCRTPSP